MAVAIAVIAVVVVLLIIGLALFLSRRAQRHRELQEMYGPEYDRAVQEKGSRKAAERDLAARAEQRSQLEIRPLDPGARQRYTQSWTQVQGRFVDDPQQAVGDADELVTAVMRERGYPTEGFDEQARLLSVDHAATLDNYRSGHHIAGLAKQRQATTEQLRQAMMHYRSLFTELVETGGEEGGSGHAGGPAGHDRAVAPEQPHHPHQPEPVQQGHEAQAYQQPGYEEQPTRQFAQPDPGPPPAQGPPQGPPAQGAPLQSGPGPMEQPTTEYRRPQFEDDRQHGQFDQPGQEPGQTQRAWEDPSPLDESGQQDQAPGVRRVSRHPDDDQEGRGQPPR